jgi:hypothetical protein
MYEVSVVSLQGILEESPRGNREVWKQGVETFLNRQWEEGREILQMFCVGQGQDVMLQNLVIVWRLRSKHVTV